MQPRIPSRPIDGDGRAWERRVGERADRDRDQVRRVLRGPEHRPSAVRAKPKPPLLSVVRNADVLVVPPADVDPLLRPARLHTERAAGPALAGETMTYGDAYRI